MKYRYGYVMSKRGRVSSRLRLLVWLSSLAVFSPIFAYYRFFKEETYEKQLQTNVSTEVSYSAGRFCVLVAITAENTGQVSVPLDNDRTYSIISIRKLGEGEWTD